MSIAAFAGGHAIRGRLTLSVLAISLATFSSVRTAAALPCLEDRFGSSVNCTANDIRITDFHDIVVTDDGCTSLADTVTFNALLTVVTTATARYDIGLFIGRDGEQALVGECVVQALPTGPPPFRNFDTDTCGDTSSSMVVEVPVSGVTVQCADANGNRLLDVAACTSWQQNANRLCRTAADVVPGTASKCNCPLFPLDIDIPVPEPQCETNADCAGRAPGCNRDVCAPDDAGADGFGCIAVPDNAECADNKFCNGAEVCTASGQCAGGTPIDCNDGIACTVDACSEQNDSCTHQPNHSACGNSLYCDGAEVCDVLLGCQPGVAVDCADGIACTNDTCNEASDSCVHTPDNAVCSNDQYCDGVETCSARNGCQPGTPIVCNDSIPCTADACNESTDSCASTPNDAACSDGKFCNGAEVCSQALGCQAGSPAICNDDVACTADSCSEQANGCVAVPNDAFCNDANACTADSCSPQNGCVFTPVTAACDDGNPCTPVDSCVSGQCTGAGTVCGNAVVDVVCGEQCDPGTQEICDNQIDDDGDGDIDCADSDCSDAVVPTCTETCAPAPPCVPIRRDPAVIRVPQLEESDDLDGVSSRRVPAEIGSFSLHGRIVPESPMDPLVDGFVVTLTNANGEIYRAEVKPVDLQANGQMRWAFRAENLDSVYADGGIAKLRIRKRTDGGETAYAVRMTAYGDFSRATLPVMTTQVYFGDDVGYVTAQWTLRPGRWTLYPTDFDDE
jgi:hypothetical protein